MSAVDEHHVKPGLFAERCRLAEQARNAVDVLLRHARHSEALRVDLVVRAVDGWDMRIAMAARPGVFAAMRQLHDRAAIVPVDRIRDLLQRRKGHHVVELRFLRMRPPVGIDDAEADGHACHAAARTVFMERNFLLPHMGNPGPAPDWTSARRGFCF